MKQPQMKLFQQPVLVESPTKKMVLTESQPVSEKALDKADVSTSSVKPATVSVVASSEPVKASQDKVSVAKTADVPVATTTQKPVLLASTKTTNTQANESVTQDESSCT